MAGRLRLTIKAYVGESIGAGFRVVGSGVVGCGLQMVGYAGLGGFLGTDRADCLGSFARLSKIKGGRWLTGIRGDGRAR
jgi:hypothetical protein